MMMIAMILMKRTAAACRSVARSISTRPQDGFGGSLDTLCPPVVYVVVIVVVDDDDGDDNLNEVPRRVQWKSR